MSSERDGSVKWIANWLTDVLLSSDFYRFLIMLLVLSILQVIRKDFKMTEYQNTKWLS